MNVGQYVVGWAVGLSIITMVSALSIKDYVEDQTKPGLIFWLFAGIGLVVIAGTVLSGVA